MTFTLHATDPSPGDQNGTFAYTVDWNNDGRDVGKYRGPATMQVSHAYAIASPASSAGYTPSVVALDQHFRSSAPAFAAPVQVAPLPPNYLSTVPVTNTVTLSISNLNQQLSAQNQINVSPTSTWKGSSVSLQVTSARPVADVQINAPPAATVTVTPRESPIASLFTGHGGGQGLQIAQKVSVAIAMLVVGLLTGGVGDLLFVEEIVEDTAEVIPELSQVANSLQKPLEIATEVTEVTSVEDAGVIESVETVESIASDVETDPSPYHFVDWVKINPKPVFILEIFNVGGSAALTVGQGTVNYSSALLGTSTDSSTVIVRGGTLDLMNNAVTGNFHGSQPLIEVDGGTLILGTPDGTNANVLATYGSAPFVDVQGNGMVIVQPGNVFNQMTSNLTVHHAGTTSVQLVSSAPTAPPGQTITFTATVTAGNAPATDGSVEFFDYTTGTFLGMERVINGAASVQANISLTTGDTIYATYLPTSNALAPSSGHLTQVVAIKTSITGPTIGVPGQPLTYTFAVNGPNQGITFTIDYGDGTTLTTSAGGPSVKFDHIYQATGNFTIQVTAQDSDGVMSQVAKQTVAIRSVALETDPSGGTALAIGGNAAGGDTITVSATDTTGKTLAVTINKTNYGKFKPTGHIFVYGQGGKDSITLKPYVIGWSWFQKSYYIKVPAFLYGEGSGGDKISAAGSAANNVLTGHGNNEVLIGGHGRDLFIAGTGTATLNAGLGSDILIGGWTNYDIGSNSGMTYDQQLIALNAVMAEWGSTDSYATRLSALASYLNSNTVHDNSSNGMPLVDQLLGNSNADDWFFAGVNDVVKGKSKIALVTTIN